MDKNKTFFLILPIAMIILNIFFIVYRYFNEIINSQFLVGIMASIIFYSGILIFYQFYKIKKMVYTSCFLLFLSICLSLAYFTVFKSIGITPIVFVILSTWFLYLIGKYLYSNNDIILLMILSKILFFNEMYKYNLALMYYDEGNYYKSIKTLKICKKNHSYFLLANNYSQINEHEKAIELYTRILQNDTNERPDILYNRGELYDRVGKYNEAINDFMDCIKCQKPDPKAYIALGVLKNEQGEYEEAKKYFSIGKSLDSSYDEFIPEKYK